MLTDRERLDKYSHDETVGLSSAPEVVVRTTSMVTVEPGVTTREIHRAVEAKGLFYPPDPASLDSCSIGGNIAGCAGGPRAVMSEG